MLPPGIKKNSINWEYPIVLPDLIFWLFIGFVLIWALILDNVAGLYLLALLLGTSPLGGQSRCNW